MQTLFWALRSSWSRLSSILTVTKNSRTTPPVAGSARGRRSCLGVCLGAPRRRCGERCGANFCHDYDFYHMCCGFVLVPGALPACRARTGCCESQFHSTCIVFACATPRPDTAIALKLSPSPWGAKTFSNLVQASAKVWDLSGGYRYEVHPWLIAILSLVGLPPTRPGRTGIIATRLSMVDSSIAVVSSSPRRSSWSMECEASQPVALCATATMPPAGATEP